MLSKEDNELMCRVGPGTAMGEAMRRFWVPALMSSELPSPDCDPVRVELLGESFVAFRDTNGQVGLLDEHCCHRGASLVIGRSENCGLRCIYHGWLFSADGTVLETPNVPDPKFKQRFKAKAYPVHEAGGLIWTYLGPVACKPLPPDFPWMDSDDDVRLNTCQINGCNYVQIIEGLFDSSHLTVLHSSVLRQNQGSELNFAQATNHMQFDAAPKLEAEETEFGFHYAAIRPLNGKAETRISAFVAPFWALNPNGDIYVGVVPMSDTKTAFYTISWDGTTPYGSEPLKSKQLTLLGFDQETLESYGQTRATFGGPNSLQPENRWRQDRQLMREGHFSGMPTLALEDSLVCVSAGPLRDRSRGRLSTADLAVSHLFRHLVNSAKQVRDGGHPIGFDLSVAKLKGLNATLELGVDWRSLVPDHYRMQPRSIART